MTPWQFGLRIGVSAVMMQFSVVMFVAMLYDVSDKFSIMSRGDQKFTGVVLAFLGYCCVRWGEYQVRQFIVMFRGKGKPNEPVSASAGLKV